MAGLKPIIKSAIKTVLRPLYPQLFYRPIDISDESVNWIIYANAGMLSRGNLYCFDYAIKNLPSEAPMVEIGSFAGLSTNLLNFYRRNHRKKNRLINCDKWEFQGADREKKIDGLPLSHLEYQTFLRDTYKRNIQMFSNDDLPYTVEMLSNDFFAAWKQKHATTDVFGRSIQLGGPISFCYIDGNHDYDFASRDFANCDQFLETGGFILFDDSADGTIFEGLRRLMNEVKATGKYELVIKNPNYLFRKK